MPGMSRDVVIVGGGIAGLAAAWRLRHRDVLLLEAGDRLGGRMRSEPRGDYWLNHGAHLFPAPGSLVDGMARECGLETVPVSGSMMGLAVGSKQLTRGRVETYPLRLPLPLRDRVAFARAGLKVQRAVARYRRGAPLRVRGPPDVRRVPGPAAAGRARHLRLRRPSRDRRAGRAVGRLRDRALRARLGRQGLADRAQPARRQRAAAGGARPRARRARPHRLPRACAPAGGRRPRRRARRRRGRRAPRHRRRAGALRRAARRAGRGAGRRRAGAAQLRGVPHGGGRDVRDDGDALRRRLRDGHPRPRVRHVHQPGARAARRRPAAPRREPDAVRRRPRRGGARARARRRHRRALPRRPARAAIRRRAA